MSVLLIKDNGDSLENNFQKILERFNFYPKNSVFIKPNLSGRAPIQKSENTDPDFLEILIKVLQKQGCQKIIIGHSSLLGTADRAYSFDKIIKESGFDRFYNLEGVELLNLDGAARKEVNVHGRTFHIPAVIYEADAYLNLAKLKTHMETVVSLSLKNQMGLLSQSDRVKFHQTDLEENIAYLGGVKPTLNIVDGILAMEANGLHHGEDKKLNLLFAGDDMVELDSFVCGIIGIDYHSVRHITKAAELGLGRLVEGEVIEQYQDKKIKIKPASDFIKVGRNIYVWPTSSCSRCITALSEGAKIYRKNFLRNLKFGSRAYLSN